MISSATFWIRAEWNVGAAWCLRVHQHCFLLSECIFCLFPLLLKAPLTYLVLQL